MLIRLLTCSILLFCAAAAAPVAPSRAQSLPALPPDQCRLDCRYQLTYQPDSTDKAAHTEVFQLQAGSRLSRFVSRNAILRNSALSAAVATAMTHTGAGGE